MEFKAGDKVICKSKYNGEAGMGYVKGMVFTIHHITLDHNGKAEGNIAWPSEDDNGVYFRALELYHEKKYNRKKLEL